MHTYEKDFPRLIALGGLAWRGLLAVDRVFRIPLTSFAPHR